MPPDQHIPVLVDQTLAMLALQPGQTVLDCTAGLGGHAIEIARRIGPTGTLLLNDADPSNLARAAARVAELAGPPRVIQLHGNFADAPRRIIEAGLTVNAVLADLGFSSNQVSDASRGFSFSNDGPLDMRLDPASPTSAQSLVNTLPEHELASIIAEYGEDRAARRIAEKIVRARADSPITTTARLAAIVRSAVGDVSRRGSQSIDPATRTFQALRIAVNDELGSLSVLLSWIEKGAKAAEGAAQPGAQSHRWLAPAARLAIISFHSLEDRPVKQAFARLAEQGLASGLSRRPVEASADEVARNPRARSAKLRGIALQTHHP